MTKTEVKIIGAFLARAIKRLDCCIKPNDSRVKGTDLGKLTELVNSTMGCFNNVFSEATDSDWIREAVKNKLEYELSRYNPDGNLELLQKVLDFWEMSTNKLNYSNKPGVEKDILKSTYEKIIDLQNITTLRNIQVGIKDVTPYASSLAGALKGKRITEPVYERRIELVSFEEHLESAKKLRKLSALVPCEIIEASRLKRLYDFLGNSTKKDLVTKVYEK